MDDKGLIAIINLCQNLTFLCLYDIKLADEHAFCNVMSQLTSLEVLHLSRGEKESLIKIISENCRMLKELELDCWKISETSFNHLKCLFVKHLRKVRINEFERFDLLSGDDYAKLKNDFPKLEVIIVKKCDYI